MELHSKGPLHSVGQTVLQKSQAVPGAMDEPPGPIKDPLRVDGSRGPYSADLYQIERQEVVVGHEGTVKHSNWAYGQEQVQILDLDLEQKISRKERARDWEYSHKKDQ